MVCRDKFEGHFKSLPLPSPFLHTSSGNRAHPWIWLFQGALEGQGLNSHCNGSRAGFSQSFRHSVKQSFGLKINSRLGNKANVLPAYRSTHISCEAMFTIENIWNQAGLLTELFSFLTCFYLPAIELSEEHSNMFWVFSMFSKHLLCKLELL